MALRLLTLTLLLWLVALVALDHLIISGLLSEAFWMVLAGVLLIAFAFPAIARQPRGWWILASLSAFAGMTIWQTGNFPVQSMLVVGSTVSLVMATVLAVQLARRAVGAEEALNQLSEILFGPMCSGFEEGQIGRAHV